MHELALSSCVVDPGSFPLEVGDPMYHTEFASWQVHTVLKALADAGFTFIQAEDEDYNTAEEQLDTFGEQIATWIPTAINASAAGEEIPAAPTLPDWVSGGRSPSVLITLSTLAIKVLIYIVVKWIEKKLDSSTSTEEVSQSIKQVHDLLEHVLTEPV